MDGGNNMRSKIISHFIKGLDILEPYGNYFHYTKCVGIFGRIGEIGKKEKRRSVTIKLSGKDCINCPHLQDNQYQ
jgi:hypothetical protein